MEEVSHSSLPLSDFLQVVTQKNRDPISRRLVLVKRKKAKWKQSKIK